MNALLLDLRHSVRALRKHPGFTLVAVMTLALAIAATTTIFAVVDAVIIRPLPFDAPDRLVQIRETTPEAALFSASEPDFIDFARENRTLVGLAAYKAADVALTGDGDAVHLHAAAVSYSIFSVLGIRPQIGRTLLPEEDAAHASSNVVVLGHALWISRFGGSQAAIGRTITLDGQPYRVIGVLPPGVHFPEGDAFVPLRADEHARRSNHWLDLVGRMRADRSIADVNTDFARITRQLGATYPTSKGWGARAEALSTALVDPSFRRAGWVLLGAAGLLLLLACTNVANLLVARATARHGEMGLRAAIGASRRRIVHLWLMEAGVIVAIATVLGVTGALWAQRVIQVVGAGGIPRLDEVTIDARVLGAAVALSVLTTFACGLIPGLRASRIDPDAVLGASARSGAPREHRRVRDALVTVQIALSLVLLVGAGLLLRSFAALSTVDLGFDADHVLTVSMNLPARYDDAGRAMFVSRLTSRLRAVPGVRAAGATVVDPLSGWNFANDVTPEDRAATTSAAGFMQAAWRAVTPELFDAMGITLLRGRIFASTDASNGPPIAIVSRSLAATLWPNADPIGKRILWGSTNGTPRTVVGVVNDIRDVAPQTAPAPTLFLLYSQVPMPGVTVLARTSGDPAALIPALRGIVRTLDTAIPVDDIHPLTRNRATATSAQRFNLWVMGGFALLAIVLATSGIYAVIAFTVVQRRREIGIRLAIGADPGNVVAMFLASGARLIAVGVAGGLIAAWLASRFMRSILFGVAPTDTLTFAVVPVILAAAAIVSTYVPARRAAEVLPTEALRGE